MGGIPKLARQEYEKALVGIAVLNGVFEKENLFTLALGTIDIGRLRQDRKYASFFETVDKELATLKLVNIRADGIEKEIKRVSCKADAQVIKASGEMKTIPVQYTAQRLKNGDLIVEM